MRKINKSIFYLLAFTFLSCNQTKSNIEEKANTTKISETTESEKGKNKIIEDVNTEIAKGSKGEESPPIKEVKSDPKPIKFIVKEKIKKVPVLDEHKVLEDIEESKVTTVDEKCYYKYDMSPVTGTVIGHHENGQLKVKATYKDGIRDGSYKLWWNNGRLKLEMTYKNGKENGLRKYWNDKGGLGSTMTYVNGKINGISKSWFYDGNLWGVGEYILGKEEGVHKMWTYDDNNSYILWSLYTYKNGQLDGESKLWHDETGKLIWIRIYKSGKLVKETNY